MTIIISLSTPDGFVVGADSTTTVSAEHGQVHQLYNSAQKIFELGPRIGDFVAGRDFSGCLVTSGAGIFGPVSWRAFASEFYRTVATHQNGSFDICREVLSFAQSKWASLQDSGHVPSGVGIPAATLMVAAACNDGAEPCGGVIDIHNGTIERMSVGEMKISGGFEVVSRVLYGYDVRILSVMHEQQMDVAKFESIAKSFSALPQLNLLPLRDAIDFVHFLIYSAIKLHRYRGGPASIGGPIEIASITSDRGFRWIVHKPLSESIGIPRGGFTT